MAWYYVAVAAAGLIMNKRQSNKSNAIARRATASEDEIRGKQLELMSAQEARAEGLYQHYQDVFMPRETELVNQAFGSEVSPARAEARATTDVEAAFKNQEQSLERRRRRLGVSPTSGSALSSDLALDVEKAKVEAGARTRAREMTRDVNFQRKAQVLGFGSPTAASPYASGAQAGAGQAASLAAARTRDVSNYAYGAAANYGASVGEAVDIGLEAWRNRQATSNNTMRSGNVTYQPSGDPDFSYVRVG